ncbi:restriction endonuclease [Streptococcus ovuberis]|uniref:Restriction endonuclease n=1 Tax=Streptococcus ovuberis TaxID=1936207 RepID=A0A7X6S247_9STRE|nr:restriction endonuclease [Streptococcus ovuberis]
MVYAKSGDNGIMYWAKEGDFETHSNVISIIYNGAIAAGLVYAQRKETGILAESYLIKVKNIEVSFETNLFLRAVLESVLYPKYSRDYLATWANKVENDKIALPTINSEIAFSYMENCIKALEAERIETLEAYLLVSGFKDYQLTQEEEDALEVFGTQQWQEFRMGDLFDRVKTKKLPYKAKELPKEPQGEFSLPALTSSFMNQGLNYYVPKEGATVLQNVISIPSNSDVYRAYFQSQEFTVLSDAYAIDWISSDKQLRPNDYLFIVPSINKVTDLPIYSYKNKLGGWNVVKDKLIKLPVNEKGEIHFDYMATLVQAIKKLAIRDVVLYADKQIEATKEVVQKGSK